MTIRFCWICGTGYNKDLWRDRFECSLCGAVFEVPLIIKESQLTLEEAEAAFNAIPLTDKKALRAAKRKK